MFTIMSTALGVGITMFALFTAPDLFGGDAWRPLAGLRRSLTSQARDSRTPRLTTVALSAGDL